MTILVALFMRSLLPTIVAFRLTTAIPFLSCHAPPGEAIEINDCHELLGSIQMSFDGNPNFLDQFLTRPWEPTWKTCSIRIALAHAPSPDRRVLRKIIYDGINLTLDQCVRDQGLGGVLTYHGIRVNVMSNSHARPRNSLHRRAGKGQRVQSLAGPLTELGRRPSNVEGMPPELGADDTSHPPKRLRIDPEPEPLSPTAPTSVSKGTGSSAQGTEEGGADRSSRNVRAKLGSQPLHPQAPPSIPLDTAGPAPRTQEAQGLGQLHDSPNISLLFSKDYNSRGAHGSAIPHPDRLPPTPTSLVHRGTWLQRPDSGPEQGIWVKMDDKWVPLPRPVYVYLKQWSFEHRRLEEQIFRGLVPASGASVFLAGRWRALSNTPRKSEGVVYALPGTPKAQLEDIKGKVVLIHPRVAMEWIGL